MFRDMKQNSLTVNCFAVNNNADSQALTLMSLAQAVCNE